MKDFARLDAKVQEVQDVQFALERAVQEEFPIGTELVYDKLKANIYLKVKGYKGTKLVCSTHRGGEYIREYTFFRPE